MANLFLATYGTTMHIYAHVFYDIVDFCEIQQLNSFYTEDFASYNESFLKTNVEDVN